MLNQVVCRSDFDKAYSETILGKTFVEDVDYYKLSSERFWQCLKQIETLALPVGSRVLDIGGGIMAVLLSRLLGYKAIVGDVTSLAQNDVQSAGLDFVAIDLFRDAPNAFEPVDLVVLQEVIEHIPQPPYIVFERIKKFLKPEGMLFFTTPNGYRIRNILYMMAGKEILGIYKYPEPGEALGHQHEYTLSQMRWQVNQADMQAIFSGYYDDGFRGASLKARIVHLLLKPATLVPHWRSGLIFAVKAGAI